MGDASFITFIFSQRLTAGLWLMEHLHRSPLPRLALHTSQQPRSLGICHCSADEKTNIHKGQSPVQRMAGRM